MKTRKRNPLILAAALGAFAGAMGCATLRHPAPVDAPETVGALAQGPSVWHAPTHATTDFGHAEIVETTDDSATDTITTVTRAPDAGHDAAPTDAAELPEVAPKSDGVTLGGAR